MDREEEEEDGLGRKRKVALACNHARHFGITCLRGSKTKMASRNPILQRKYEVCYFFQL